MSVGMSSVQQRVALVTGGSHGLGSAIAPRLAFERCAIDVRSGGRFVDAIHVYRPRASPADQPVDPDQPEQLG